MLTWISLTTVGLSHIVCQGYTCILLSQNAKVGWVGGLSGKLQMEAVRSGGAAFGFRKDLTTL